MVPLVGSIRRVSIVLMWLFRPVALEIGLFLVVIHFIFYWWCETSFTKTRFERFKICFPQLSCGHRWTGSGVERSKTFTLVRAPSAEKTVNFTEFHSTQRGWRKKMRATRRRQRNSTDSSTHEFLLGASEGEISSSFPCRVPRRPGT